MFFGSMRQKRCIGGLWATGNHPSSFPAWPKWGDTELWLSAASSMGTAGWQSSGRMKCRSAISLRFWINQPRNLPCLWISSSELRNFLLFKANFGQRWHLPNTATVCTPALHATLSSWGLAMATAVPNVIREARRERTELSFAGGSRGETRKKEKCSLRVNVRHSLTAWVFGQFQINGKPNGLDPCTSSLGKGQLGKQTIAMCASTVGKLGSNQGPGHGELKSCSVRKENFTSTDLWNHKCA